MITTYNGHQINLVNVHNLQQQFGQIHVKKSFYDKCADNSMPILTIILSKGHSKIERPTTYTDMFLTPVDVRRRS